MPLVIHGFHFNFDLALDDSVVGTFLSIICLLFLLNFVSNGFVSGLLRTREGPVRSLLVLVLKSLESINVYSLSIFLYIAVFKFYFMLEDGQSISVHKN